MNLPYSLKIRVRNKRHHSIQVGNRLVQGKSYQWVELVTREGLVEALRLERDKQIRIVSEIPKDLLGARADSTAPPFEQQEPVKPSTVTSPAPAPSSGPVNYQDLLNKPVIPTKVSQLTNDANYVRGQDVFNGNYANLSNKPLIPSKTSELQNDSAWVYSEAIGSIAVVTQAEYDALPATKNTDNVLYLLKGDA